ncbi:MAG: transcriptional repressor [Nocardia sp.]|nr:transcriptional repressor [Nocardia sp.]
MLGADRRNLTAGEIHRAACASNARSVGFTTVYRTLAQLVDEGRVVIAREPGNARRFRVAARPGDRHGLWCVQCGHAQPISTGGIVDAMERFAHAQGFVDLEFRINVQGCCRDCRDRTHALAE